MCLETCSVTCSGGLTRGCAFVPNTQQGWHLWLSIMNSQSLRSGEVTTNEDRLKSAHALATLNHAVKMVRQCRALPR